MGGSQSVPAKQEPFKPYSLEYLVGEGPIHRAADSLGQLKGTWDDSITDMATVWNKSVAQYGNSPCCGHRATHGEMPYEWVTYTQMNTRVVNFGSGVRQLGLEPGKTLGVYAKNSANWVVCEQAAYQQGLIIVSIYDTLGKDTCSYVVNHAELSLVVCEKNTFNSLVAVKETAECLKVIVVMGEVDDAMRQAAGDVRVLSMAEVEEMGSKQPFEQTPITSETLCTIMYTSGTTGMPKGVMLTHGNIIATIAGAISRGLHVTPNDLHISYLPLAHVFERCVLAAVWSRGAQCAFYRGDPRKLVEDMQACQPTILFGVPRVFNTLHDRVMAGVEKASGFKRSMFRRAFAAKTEAMRTGTTADRWDNLVFRKIREMLVGSRLRLVVSGSAPLSENVQHWLRVVFNCPVLQGYGLTETAAACTLPVVSDPTNSHVGPPLFCSEIKLVDVPELNYYSCGWPQRGEICVRGLNVFKGYYKDKAETEAVLEPSGWFHTGDIGEWTHEGNIRIIDRKKNIFKLSQGEYIAAEKLELTYRDSQFLEQIWIYGNSFQNSILAVGVIRGEASVQWANEQGLKGAADDKAFLKSLCENQAFQKAVLNDLVALGKAAKFNGYELPKGVVLDYELWSVDNDLLTPTFKAKRKELQNKYQAQIDEAYKRIEGTASAPAPAPATTQV